MGLERVIGKDVTLIEATSIQRGRKTFVHEVNASHVVWNVAIPWKIVGSFYFVVSLVIVGYFMQSAVRNAPSAVNTTELLAYASLLLPSLACFLYGCIQTDKFLIFDRINQTVTIPRSFYFSSDVVAWEDAVGIAKKRIFNSVTKEVAAIRSPYRKSTFMAPAIPISIEELDAPHESWSFWLWYMDKNRPLPPSPTLDTYREAEIERLRKEGFPSPNTPCFFYELVIDGVSYPTGTPCESIWPPA